MYTKRQIESVNAKVVLKSSPSLGYIIYFLLSHVFTFAREQNIPFFSYHFSRRCLKMESGSWDFSVKVAWEERSRERNVEHEKSITTPMTIHAFQSLDCLSWWLFHDILLHVTPKMSRQADILLRKACSASKHSYKQPFFIFIIKMSVQLSRILSQWCNCERRLNVKVTGDMQSSIPKDKHDSERYALFCPNLLPKNSYETLFFF